VTHSSHALGDRSRCRQDRLPKQLLVCRSAVQGKRSTRPWIRTDGTAGARIRMRFAITPCCSRPNPRIAPAPPASLIIRAPALPSVRCSCPENAAAERRQRSDRFRRQWHALGGIVVTGLTAPLRGREVPSVAQSARMQRGKKKWRCRSFPVRVVCRLRTNRHCR